MAKKKEVKKISKFETVKEELEILLENFPIKKFLIILFFAGFLLLIAGILLPLLKLKFTCGDETAYGQCSINKPYFCSSGILIEKASICGCNSNLSLTGDSCVSKYQEETKKITLNYILRGEEKEINFLLYKKMANYLSNLPASISPKNGENLSRATFKLRNINNEEQRNLLIPLVVRIQNLAKDKTEQIRIAVSIVQKIPFGASNKTFIFGNNILNYSRYPYETLYERQGICGEKSELLAFLLKELGYEVVLFYNAFENHESVGIKCPLSYSYKKTGYCFVETTGGAIISDSGIIYTGIGRIYSEPEIILISKGKSLGTNLYEYKDADDLKKMRNAIEDNDGLNIVQNNRMKELEKKYGLEKSYNPT